MKAIAITPGTTTFQLIDRPEPQLVAADEVKLQVLHVGICSTDREEVSGGRADAPKGQSQLVIGHEMFGQVLQVGSQVKRVEPGDFAVFTVRRGCGHCPACEMNRSDMCYSGDYTERGIKAADGFQAEIVVDHEQYLVKVPPSIAHLGVLTEPMSVIEKAIDEAVRIQMARLPDLKHANEALRDKVALVAGLGPIGLLAAVALRLRGAKVIGLDIIDETSPRTQLLKKLGGVYVDGRQVQADALDDHFGQIDMILEATGVALLEFNLIDALGINGIYVITGIPGGDRPLELPGAALMRQSVLYNQVIVGSVNASPAHFQMAVDDLKKANEQWPQVMKELITRRVPFTQFDDALTQHSDNDIKVVIEWASSSLDIDSNNGTAHQPLPRVTVAPNKPLLTQVAASIHDANKNVRWEALRTLCLSSDPSALQAVTQALIDEDAGVRWLAADRLAKVGEKGIEPLLSALMEHADSPWLRQGALRILHFYMGHRWGKKLAPVLEALNGIQPALTVPPIAQKVLHSFSH